MGSDSDSDNESPEVISSSVMKSERQKEFQDISAQKQRLKEEQKLKRKLKTERLQNQKKEKKSKLQQPEHDPYQLFSSSTSKDNSRLPHPHPNQALESEAVEEPDEVQVTEADTEILDEEIEKSKKNTGHRKFYPKYNVVVEPLSKLQNPRAAAAISFKEKRLAKVPRENVASAVLSYREKMLVKNT